MSMFLWGRRRWAVITSVFALALILASPAVSATNAHAAYSPAPNLVPSETCGCPSQVSGLQQLASEFRGHGPPHESNFDEQLGITFSQSFTSLEYNVTAVKQTDPTLNTGPAYLLNGLSNTGFWYQVGVSWNWDPGSATGTGFSMNYEVFDALGNSIYPQNGGGLSSFSGIVNPGDTVTLNLYFNNSSQVVMIAEDRNTGAFAQQTFSSEQGTYFTGLPNSVANSNGFFTGLMTEWYHGDPYYQNLVGAVYQTNLAISAGWMWMDEFNAGNDALVFAANATAPTQFTAQPTLLQEFSYNGTTEYASGEEFVTGALPSGSTTTTTTSTSTSSTPTVPLTFSYEVLGGGTGYGAPTLTYVSQGVQQTISIAANQTTVNADLGSGWSVSATLPGSDSTERWVSTGGATSGTATASTSVLLQYQYEYYVDVEPNVATGGTVTPSSPGWYDAGQSVTLAASPNSGWALEDWLIDGQTSESGQNSVTLTLDQPINATALFYPGLDVTAGGSVSVSYDFAAPSLNGSTVTIQLESGTVAPGTTKAIYAPPGSTLSLNATPTSFLYSFAGWLGLHSGASRILVSLTVPGSLTAESTLNYDNIAIAGVVLIVAAILIILLGTRRRGPSTPAVQEQPAPTAPGDTQPPTTQPPAPAPSN